MNHSLRSAYKLTVLANRPPHGKSPEQFWKVSAPVEWRIMNVGSHDEIVKMLPGVEVMIGTDFTAKMTHRADSLKAILVPAAGYDRIDLDALPPDVIIANAYCHEWPIAEWVIACAIMLDHEILAAEKSFRSGSWDAWPGRKGPYREIRGKTFGIIGPGNIGRRVAELALTFGMRVLAAGRAKAKQKILPRKLPEEVEYGTDQDAFQRVLKESDFVLVSVPLSSQTRNLIGRKELALMKPTAYLLNPARGHIVEEKALFTALKEKHIAGAAIDTWYRYPQDQTDSPRPAALPFWTLENVIMTPHISGATDGTLHRRAKIVAANIDRLYGGKPLENVVWPENLIET